MVDIDKLKDADDKIEDGEEDRKDALTGDSSTSLLQVVNKKTPRGCEVFFY